MKKLFFLMITIVLSVFIAMITFGAGELCADEFEDLAIKRITTMYIEGQKFGDLVLGARARFDFLYVDGLLVKASIASGKTPDWLKWHLGHFGSPQARGKELFVLRYETYKPFDFDPFKIAVNGMYLSEKEVLTKLTRIPTGSLPTGAVGDLAFVVPRSSDGVYNIIYEGNEIRIDLDKFRN